MTRDLGTNLVHRGHGWVLLAAVALLSSGSASPQEAPRFEETAHVVVVDVPVNVTDRDGEPVRDLEREDFVLLDDGTSREIVAFETVDLEFLQTSEPSAAAQDSVLPSAARRHFLIVFDLTFSSTHSILRARHAVREIALSGLHPTDLVAVATFSLEAGPEILVTFTPDRAQVARAIDTLGARDLVARGNLDPLRFLIDSPGYAESTLLGGISGSGSSSSNARPSGLVTPQGGLERAVQAHLSAIGKRFDRSRKGIERGRIGSWSSGLADLARALNSVDGRKHVILLSEGFDSRLLLGHEPGSALRQSDNQALMRGDTYLVDSDDTYGNTALQRQIDQMVQEFRRADCIVQTVDIGGLRTGGGASGEASRRGQESLFYFANETGGELFKDANDLEKQLSEVLKRNSVTYVLSFWPTGIEADGAFHRVRVELKDEKKRYRVAHRAGFYAPRPFADLHPLEKNLLASDAIASAFPRQELSLDVLAVPFRASEQGSYVPVILEVGGAALLDDHSGSSLDVEIYGYVSDESGEMKDFFSQWLTLDLDQVREGLERGGLKYYGHLDLQPGRHLVRVLVRNAQNGRTAVKTANIQVPEFGSGSPVLLPPLFPEEQGRWLLVRENEDRLAGDSVVYPFTVKGEAYIPAVRPQVRQGEERQVCLVAYNLGEGDLEISSRVTTEDGQPFIGGRLSQAARTPTGIPDYDKILLTFATGDMPPGQYTLVASLVDPSTGQELSSEQPFRVIP